MKKLQNVSTVLAAIVLIIRIFFENNMSEKLYDISFVLLVVLFSLMIISVIAQIQKNKAK